MNDPLSEPIRMRTTTTKGGDDTFMHQGQTRTLILRGVTKDKKIVTRFSEDLPSTGIVWHKYDELDTKEKKLVNNTEPDLMKSGEPKTKFANRINLHFADEVTGREFFKLFEGRDGKADWEKCDVVFYESEDGEPWSNFAKFLSDLGAVPEDEKPLGEYLKVGDKFEATLMLGNDKYLHLDPTTLTPLFNVANEPESEPLPELSQKGFELLQMLKDQEGIEIAKVVKNPAWSEVKKYVKSYTQDGVHIKIME